MPLGLIAFLGFIMFLSWLLPYLIPVAIIGWLGVKYHKGIISFLVQVPSAIWKLHLSLGEGFVRAVRDYPISEYWKDNYYKSSIMRTAVIFWLTVPILFLAALILAGMFVREVQAAAIVFKLVWFVGLLMWVLAVEFVDDGPTTVATVIFCFFSAFITPWPSAIAIVYGYYRYYWRGPLTHYRLVDFDKELFMMWADAMFALVLIPLEIQLWWLTQKKTLSTILTESKGVRDE